MVILCNTPYQNTNYDSYFSTFPFLLSDFQKYAIEAIVREQHVLVTAHTGSGKTVPAEFAIEYIVGKGKKVIYTSPIIALSNQKCNDLQKKFPTISFGILTGDNCKNPDADVLIMTTEILRNKLMRMLFDKESQTTGKFNLDLDQLGAVIFDEVHYFSDKDRGIVWEEALMCLPPQVNLIMLSASLNNPESFASWIENRHVTDSVNMKKVYLSSTDHRVVPLKHYVYVTVKQSDITYMKDKHKSDFDKIKRHINKFLTIKDADRPFYEDNFKMVKDIIYYKDRQIIGRSSPSYIINQLVNKLKDENMLPAIYFILSKKNIEKYSYLIEATLYDDDSTMPNRIEGICEQILRNGVSNFREYMMMPAYERMIKLLKKGIAIHHAGILPIFREMIEILLSDGIIKLLLCTETFAVGLNMPVKTTIMSSLDKFSGSHMRFFSSSEYLQMAGRAGRRGHDQIGHVIHVNDMFELPSIIEYKQILNGSPLTLSSNYDITFNSLLLNAKYKETNVETLESISGNSFSTISINATCLDIRKQIDTCLEKMKTYIKPPSYDEEKINEYNTFRLSMLDVTQNRRNKMRKQLVKMETNIVDFEKCLKYYDDHKYGTEFVDVNNKLLDKYKHIWHNRIENMTTFITTHNYYDQETNKLTEKGEISLLIQEIPSLVFSELIVESNYFENLDVIDLILLFSIYNNTRSSENKESISVVTVPTSSALIEISSSLESIHHKIINDSAKYNIVPFNDTINYNMFCIYDWIQVENENEAILFLENLQAEHGLDIGTFSKATIKIDNIGKEMTTVAELMGNIELAHKLSSISEKLLKYIVTNQSLYV